MDYPVPLHQWTVKNQCSGDFGQDCSCRLQHVLSTQHVMLMTTFLVWLPCLYSTNRIQLKVFYQCKPQTGRQFSSGLTGYFRAHVSQTRRTRINAILGCQYRKLLPIPVPSRTLLMSFYSLYANPTAYKLECCYTISCMRRSRVQ